MPDFVNVKFLLAKLLSLGIMISVEKGSTLGNSKNDNNRGLNSLKCVCWNCVAPTFLHQTCSLDSKGLDCSHSLAALRTAVDYFTMVIMALILTCVQ